MRISVFFILAAAGFFFLFFTEKRLDFFAFFRYHILRSGKKAAQSQRRQGRYGKSEDGMSSFSFSFCKQHIGFLSVIFRYAVSFSDL